MLKKRILLIFIISLLIQLVFIILLNVPIERDAKAYYVIGKSLTLGKGFVLEDGSPAAYAKPLYCLMLAGIFFISWGNIFMVKIIQAILIAATCIVIFKIAKEIFNERIGFWAALITAVFPPFWAISSNLLPENLFIPLLALAIYVLVRAEKENSTKLFVYSGLLFGLTTQARPTSIFLPFFIFLFGLPISKIKLEFIKRFLLIFIITIGCVLPWTIRNYMVFKIFSPALESAEVLWIGTYTKGACYSDNINTTIAAGELKKKGRDTVLDMSKLRFSSGLENLKSDSFGYLKMFPLKFIRLWVGSYSNIFNISVPFSELHKSKRLLKQNLVIFLFKSFNLCASFALLILGLIGMFLAFKSKKWVYAHILFAVFFYFSLIHMILIAETRYGIPAFPYLIIFAIFALGDLLKRGEIT